MNVEPIAARLPRVQPDAARLSRIAFDARFERMAARLAGRRDLHVLRREPPEQPTVLELAAGNGSLAVALDTREWPALEMALALPDEADACAVATLLLAPWLQALDPLLPAARVRRRRRLTAASRREPCAVVATTAAEIAMVSMDDALRASVRCAIDARPVHVLPALSALLLRPRLVLLERPMPAGALSTLSQGDVVLTGRPAQTPRSLVLVLGKGITMQVEVTLDPSTDQIATKGVPALRPEADAPEAPDGTSALQELQVPVSFELDTARISLGELASIRPGYVIELEQPLQAAAVRLVCHGQTVGQGQLVAVGDQMGVRIVRMGLPPAAGGAA